MNNRSESSRREFLAILVAPIALAACGSAHAGTIDVAKSPSCGCCTQWVERLRANGFTVNVMDTDDLDARARQLGVPNELRSCHTAIVGAYVIEGHVPVADIERLLRERPPALGLAVPGMPAGSPGMEQGDRREPFATMLFDRNGRYRVFAQHSSLEGRADG